MRKSVHCISIRVVRSHGRPSERDAVPAAQPAGLSGVTPVAFGFAVPDGLVGLTGGCHPVGGYGVPRVYGAYGAYGYHPYAHMAIPTPTDTAIIPTIAAISGVRLKAPHHSARCDQRAPQHHQGPEAMRKGGRGRKLSPKSGRV